MSSDILLLLNDLILCWTLIEYENCVSLSGSQDKEHIEMLKVSESSELFNDRLNILIDGGASPSPAPRLVLESKSSKIRKFIEKENHKTIAGLPVTARSILHRRNFQSPLFWGSDITQGIQFFSL